MSAKERVLEALSGEGEEYPEAPIGPNWRERQRQMLQRKNLAAISEFLGKGSRTYMSAILPRYYCGLLTWALHQYLARRGWKIASALGYRSPEPVYMEVSTGDDTENLLMDGQLLIEKGNERCIVTLDMNPKWRGSVQVEGLSENKEELKQFISDVLKIAEEENFYRGKKIEFSGQIRFLNVQERVWDGIILDADIKAEVKANTVGFLKQSDRWTNYGIPSRRGVLLDGEPGTGKTVICKALMAEADGITCIITNGYAMSDDDYITELYELAEDLSPCIVFIEDIDLIGQDRLEFGYPRGPALLTLLAVLDGVEEQSDMVTVATTNSLETLDKALSQRPSRFDRVIRLSRPSLEQRRELVRRLCLRIPLGDDLQEYLATKAEGSTPAQIQEMVYGLVIQCPSEDPAPGFNRSDIDRVMSRINGRNGHRMGFAGNGN